MSADNAITYRMIEGKWYVMMTFASNEYTNEDYQKNGEKFDALQQCLMRAHEMANDCCVLEYGIYHDVGEIEEAGCAESDCKSDPTGKTSGSSPSFLTED